LNELLPVYGNYEDKYNTKNLISRILVKGFLGKFDENLLSLSSRSIRAVCEVGCAEGELLKRIHGVFPDANLVATDISEHEIAKARKNSSSMPVDFSIQNAEDLEAYPDSGFDLVVCCEVLEHLSNPKQGLNELHRISKKFVLVSVPNEPIWRILNLFRGKYVKSWGNTPGHLNHWTVDRFPKFLTSAEFRILARSYPLPWQMFLLEKK
jgi:2-polyprenyl-3-methyl-5-hydroxy-6-metoxy-1,4-benzoquinol methylase